MTEEDAARVETPRMAHELNAPRTRATLDDPSPG